MRLRLRILIVLIRSLFQRKLPPDEQRQSVLTFRVLPTDCVLKYMGNDRHHAFMDCGRIDLMLQYIRRSDILRHKINPFVYTVDILYYEPLRIFSRFVLITTLADWDKRFFWLEHLFVQDGKVVGVAISKNGLKCKNRIVPPTNILAGVAANIEKYDYIKKTGPLVNGMLTLLRRRIKEVNREIAESY